MCRNWKGFLGKVEGSQLFLYRGSCKMWACPDCAKDLRGKWRHHLMKEIQRLNSPFWAFFTITAPSYGDADFTTQRDLSYKLFKSQWKAFFTQFKRYLGYSPQYIRVFELQERGAVHCHCLIDTWLLCLKQKEYGGNTGKTYEAWLNKHATDYGFGFMTHAINLESEPMRVAFYVTKYMSKGDTQENGWLPKNARYIQTSRGFKPMNTRSKSEDRWIYVTNNLKIECGTFEVYDVQKKRSVEYKDLDENFEYY